MNTFKIKMWSWLLLMSAFVCFTSCSEDDENENQNGIENQTGNGNKNENQTGSGDENEDQTGSGDENENQSDIVGTWQSEYVTSWAKENGVLMEDECYDGPYDQAILVFKADGSFSQTDYNEGYTETGTYKLIENKLIITEEGESEESKVLELSNDKLVLEYTEHDAGWEYYEKVELKKVELKKVELK